MTEVAIIGENACGYKLTGNIYMADVPTKKWLIFLHGIGEKGPVDGSELDELETHGYPKHIAKNGLSLPFNVIAPQSAVTGYRNMMNVVIPHLILKYEAEAIVQTGLSMGGIGTWNMLWWDEYKQLKAIAPVCGRPEIRIPDTTLIDYPGARNIPVLTVHGLLDTTVRFSYGDTAVKELNKINPGQAKMIPLPGVAHNAWDKAYDVKDPVGMEVLEFIVKHLEGPNSMYLRGYNDCKSRAISILNGL